ncbi:MAG: hypothetical protein DRP08_05535, partial [Candidatus Aenigmatarchaeota archaeon]
EFRKDGSSLLFYTKYDDVEKTTNLGFFRESSIDIDGDGTDDISAKLTFYPSVERPLSLAICIKVMITRLSGFSELDDKEFFEAYVEMFLPGLLKGENADDRIRFGYQSEYGELIPDEYSIVYKYIPNFMKPLKQLVHKLEMDTGSASGKADLSLIFSYADIDSGKTNSEMGLKVLYEPVRNPVVSFSRGHGVVELNREDTDNSRVSSYVTYKAEGKSVNAYALDVPECVTFTFDTGRNGKIEFDTHGKPADEIGVCDDVDDPVNKLYFSNLASIAGIEWSRALLFKKSASVHGYSDGSDLTMCGHFENASANNIVDFVVIARNKIDFTVDVDLDLMFINVSRNEFDVSFSLDAQLNKTIISSSFDVDRVNDGSLMILFNELSSDNVDVTVSSSRTLTISNLMVTVDIPGVDVGIFADSVMFSKGSEFNFVLKPSLVGGMIYLNVSLSFGNDHGITISGFMACLNGWCSEPRDVVDSISFEFGIDVLEIHVASDFSWGYIKIRSIYFSTVHSFMVNGELGGIVGIIDVSSGDFLNISWSTDVDGNKSFVIDGSAVARLEGFHLWLGDRIDVSIPLITCAFVFDGSSGSGSFELVLDESSVDVEVDVDGLSFEDLLGVDLSLSVALDVSGSGSGYLFMSWNKTGLTEFSADLNDIAGSGSINITDFMLVGTLIVVSFSQFFISGDLGFEIHVLDKNFTLSAGGAGTITDIVLNELYLDLGLNAVIPVAVTANINFDGQGIIAFEYADGNFTAHVEVVGDSDIAVDQLWMEIPGLYLVAFVQDLIVLGETSITVEVDTSGNIPIQLFVNTVQEITIYAIGVGYISSQMLYVYDVHGGAGGGYFGVGLGSESGQPVFYI